MNRTNIKSDFHVISLDELQKTLCVDFESGLSKQKARELLILNGPNNFGSPSYLAIYMTIAKNIFNGFACLLWLAFILSCVSYKLNEKSSQIVDHSAYLAIGLIILLIILTQVLLSVVQTWTSIKSIRSNNDIFAGNKTNVLREGAKQKINSTDLVSEFNFKFWLNLTLICFIT